MFKIHLSSKGRPGASQPNRSEIPRRPRILIKTAPAFTLKKITNLFLHHIDRSKRNSRKYIYQLNGPKEKKEGLKNGLFYIAGKGCNRPTSLIKKEGKGVNLRDHLQKMPCSALVQVFPFMHGMSLL